MTPREREVRRIARNLLKQVQLDAAPIDPAYVAMQKYLSVGDADLPAGVYGALTKRGNDFGILVSPACPTAGHRNFTIAHELGHCCIPGHVEALLPPGTEIAPSLGGHFRDYQNREEREADWFASELLAPRDLALPRIRELEASMETLTTLAGEFATSLTMMALRYAELTDEAVATVSSHKGRIEWVIASERIREHSWGRKVRRGDFVPRGTATLALAGDPYAVARGEQRTDSNLLCEWFEGAPGVVSVEEDAIGLGSFGRVLTFLVAPDLLGPEELQELQSDEDRPKDWRDALRGYELD